MTNRKSSIGNKDYDFNVWFNTEESRFTIYAFKLVVDSDGYLTPDSDEIIDRLDIYVDDKMTVQQAEVITYVLSSGEWLGVNGIDYLCDVEFWSSWAELFSPDEPVPALLQELVDRLPENKLERELA